MGLQNSRVGAIKVSNNAEISTMKVAAVVWFEVNGQYQFINGDITSVEIQSSANDENILPFTHTVQNGKITVTSPEVLDANSTLYLYSTCLLYTSPSPRDA